MRIAVFGTGYVGLTTGVCLAELGNSVTCIDIDKSLIDQLTKGKIHFFEPGLEQLAMKNIENKKLYFTNDGRRQVQENDFLMIAVGTPANSQGGVDLSQVETVAQEIGRNINSYKIIIIKSTVPPGTYKIVKRIIREEYSGDFDIVSNPEFLREGRAIDDTLHPDRIVVGTSSEKALKMIKELYSSIDSPIIITDNTTAETIKYASNAYLATSISFINSVAEICEAVGADIAKVAEAMRYDKRIGQNAFIDAGAGYGGSCFPKDVSGFIEVAEKHGVDFDLLKVAESINEKQRELIVEKVKMLVPKINNASICIWGLAFKPNTDDIREAPAVSIIKELKVLGAKIKAYDPVANRKAKKVLPDIQYTQSPLEAAKDCDILVVLTEWEEFTRIDLEELKESLRQPNIVDGRNMYDPKRMKKLGFNYVGVGR